MPHDLTIDFMQAAEIPAASGLLSQAFNISAISTAEEVAAVYHGRSDPRGVLFAAHAGGRLVGVVQCFRHADSDETKMYGIARLAVAPDCRDQGIGHALMEHAENHIRDAWLHGKAGYAYLGDATKRDNPASTFYDDMGYDPYGGVSNDGEPLMIKYLNRSGIPAP